MEGTRRLLHPCSYLSYLAFHVPAGCRQQGVAPALPPRGALWQRRQGQPCKARRLCDALHRSLRLDCSSCRQGAPRRFSGLNAHPSPAGRMFRPYPAAALFLSACSMGPAGPPQAARRLSARRWDWAQAALWHRQPLQTRRELSSVFTCITGRNAGTHMGLGGAARCGWWRRLQCRSSLALYQATGPSFWL